MEVTEAPPAMMEVDSTILERVEKVCTNSFSIPQGGWFSRQYKSHLQVEKVTANDEAQYQPPSELEPGQVNVVYDALCKYFCQDNTNTSTLRQSTEVISRWKLQSQS